VEDIVVFLGLNVFNSGNSYAFLHKTCSSNFCEETMYTKKLYPIPTGLDMAFKGTVVNRTLPVSK